MRAQLKLAELRFGDAVVHQKFGRGIVSALESETEGGLVEMYWLNPFLQPVWRGPRVRASELSVARLGVTGGMAGHMGAL